MNGTEKVLRETLIREKRLETQIEELREKIQIQIERKLETSKNIPSNVYDCFTRAAILYFSEFAFWERIIWRICVFRKILSAWGR